MYQLIQVQAALTNYHKECHPYLKYTLSITYYAFAPRLYYSDFFHRFIIRLMDAHRLHSEHLWMWDLSLTNITYY